MLFFSEQNLEKPKHLYMEISNYYNVGRWIPISDECTD